MSDHYSTFAAAGVTDLLSSPARSPADRQLLEQLEQLRPHHPGDRLSIGLFVLGAALFRMPLAPAAAVLEAARRAFAEAAHILWALRKRCRPAPVDLGWALLSEALQHLSDQLLKLRGLLAATDEPILPRFRSVHAFASHVLEAGWAQDWGDPIFTGLAISHDPGDGEVAEGSDPWSLLPDERTYFRDKVTTDPRGSRISLGKLFNKLERELVSEATTIRNRIMGAERLVPLPQHLVWHVTPSADPYVMADLANLKCDWRYDIIILPEGLQLPIAVYREDSRRWSGDQLHDHFAEREPAAGRIEIHGSSNNQIAIHSTGAAQSIVVHKDAATPAATELATGFVPPPQEHHHQHEHRHQYEHHVTKSGASNHATTAISGKYAAIVPLVISQVKAARRSILDLADFEKLLIHTQNVIVPKVLEGYRVMTGKTLELPEPRTVKSWLVRAGFDTGNS
jgi:hypothetical protein